MGAGLAAKVHDRQAGAAIHALGARDVPVPLATLRAEHGRGLGGLSHATDCQEFPLARH